MMIRLLLSSLVAFAVAALAVWTTSKTAVKLGFVDPPGPLKIHRGPIPRLGGIGIFFGFLAGAALAIRPVHPEAWRVLPALILIWLSGLLDDLFQLSPLVRLTIQIVAGVIVALVYRPDLYAVDHVAALFYVLKTCFTIIVFTNAFNFLDGSDGLAAGGGAIAAVGFAIVMARQMPEWSGIAAAIAAASCGFLLFNFPPASIFMGDSGSTVVGFLLAVMALRFDFSVRHTSLVPLIIVAIPLIDFGLAVLRRVSSGRSVFEGDRFHFYDLLLQKGWSPRSVALCTYALAIGCVALALTIKD
jgi:UDP-GlcNAc:undecaprenyl-phosphate GlcNAc-1-phosphate transferase